MTSPGTTWRQKYLLPFSLGIADGIVNALTLASSSVLHGKGLTPTLGLKVGAVAFVSAIFTVFVAEYAQLRAGLRRAEHELNMTTSGRFAASNLGRAVRRDALLAALVASVSSFVGAVVPLMIGAFSGRYSASALAVSVLGLGLLGAGLSSAVGGRRAVWILAMVIMGAIVAVIGVVLDIA